LKIPSKMSTVDNVGGSFVASFLLGWLVWPFVIWAYRIKQNESK